MKRWQSVLVAGLLASATTAGAAVGSVGAAGAAVARASGGGTFTFAAAADPGSLNPLNNTSTSANWLFRFLYDPLVALSPSGKLVPGLATSWKFNGTTAVFTIRTNATCSNGSKITPSVIAKNFAWLKNPANPSMDVGALIPNRNFSYSADDANHTFRLTLAAPYSELLDSLTYLPMVCGAAANDPASLTTTSSGSGPFVLTSATPNSQYVMTRRKGYDWGFEGGTTSAAGFPSKVVMEIVPDETTEANLLISKQINAAVINGPDRHRVAAAGATSEKQVSGDVVMMFNQSSGRVTADRAVRLALTMATQRALIARAVTEQSLPTAGTSVSAEQPQVCDDAAAASAIPAYDVKSAEKLLTKDGWVAGSNGIRSKKGTPLAIDLVYSTGTPGTSNAAILLAAEWKAIGVDVTITPMTQAAYVAAVFATGDFDAVLSQFSNPFPSTLVGLLSGPFPPNGTNAGHITDAAYSAAATLAMKTPGAKGCADWVAASKALFRNADMIPVANWPTNWMFEGATMETEGGRPIPVTIRLTK